MKKLKVVYDYKGGRSVRLVSADEKIVFHLRTVEVIRLLQKVFDYYQEKRIEEIGSNAFYQELLQMLTEKLSEGRKKLIEEQFKQLSSGEVETGIEEVKQNSFNQLQEEAQKTKKENAKNKKVDSDNSQSILPNEILKWAIKEND